MTELRGDLAVEQPRASQRRSGLYGRSWCVVATRLVRSKVSLLAWDRGLKRSATA